MLQNNKGLLPDFKIRQYAKNGMISNFVDYHEKKAYTLSYGLSPYGYDVRLANQLKIYKPSKTIDVKNVSPQDFTTQKGEKLVIPANSFALGVTVEKITLPKNMYAICIGKSSYARCGIVLNVTPLQPESSSHVTLEFSNTTQNNVTLYANEGICQIIFIESEKCEKSYKEFGGAYINQKDQITLPKI